MCVCSVCPLRFVPVSAPWIWGFQHVHVATWRNRLRHVATWRKCNFATWRNCNGPAPLQKCAGDFCCIAFARFCRGYSWRTFLSTFFPQRQENESGDKIGEKIRRLNNRNPRKIVLPKTDPNNCSVAICYLRNGPFSKRLHEHELFALVRV